MLGNEMIVVMWIFIALCLIAAILIVVGHFVIKKNLYENVKDDLFKEMVNNQVDLPREYSETLNDNFWELL